MILFFDKTDGSIFGTISGRVHSDQEMKMSMSSNNLPANKIGKFIVPFEKKTKQIQEEVRELVIEGKKVVEKITGMRTVTVGDGMIPKTKKHNDMIIDFEEGRKSPTDYKIKIDKNGELEDLILK